MISCVVTTKNEEHVIDDLLKSIKTQSYKNFEIVVVDNNSIDDTRKISAFYTKKVFTKGPERSVQRNFGVQKCRGEYILILDADMRLAKNVLRDLDKKISRSPDLGAVIIPEKSFGIGFWAKVKTFERSFYIGDESIEAARFFKKSIFVKFGGYDVSMTGPEDYDLPYRIRKAGIKIGRIRSSIFHNEKRFSPFKSAKKKFYYASRAGNYIKKHPELIFSQGNMLFRPIFIKRWRKLITHPGLSLAMLVLKAIEAVAALAGVVYSVIIRA